MANYVNSTLIDGEKVMCKAHYHWIWWIVPVLTCLVLVLGGIAIDAAAEIGGGVAAVCIIIALIILGCFILRYKNDEIVITNHRVVQKTGIIARDVFEMQIQKVETIAVDQTIMGRALNYGRVICRGTGGTSSKPVVIAAPLAYRAAFQNAIRDASQPQPAPAVTPAINEKAEAFANVVREADSDRLDEIIELLKQINTKLDRTQN